MTAGWDFAPACRPTVRRSPSPLGLGESHSFQRPIPKPPEPPVEAQSSQFNPSGSMSRKAGTGGARRHVDRRGRPRVRRAPEGGQDRGSSRRARTRPAGAPSAAERALRAIAAAKFDLGPRPREPARAGQQAARVGGVARRQVDLRRLADLGGDRLHQHERPEHELPPLPPRLPRGDLLPEPTFFRVRRPKPF